MGGIEVSGLFGLIHLILVIWAILNIAQARESALVRGLWIVFVIFLPLIGIIVWFFLGPRARGYRRGY